MITGFGNNVISSLAADITAGQTTIQVMPGTGAKFAGLLNYDYANASNPLQTYAKITLTDAKETVFEICHLISVNNDVLTVVRGQEGTTAKGWALNDVIANFATRGSENQFVQIEQLQSGHYISGVAGGTANALTLELPATYFVNGSTDWTLRTPIVVYPTQNNTGAATLQLTMGGRVLGTFKLYKGNKAELVANDILKDTGLVCLLDNTKAFFNVMNPSAIYAGLGTAAFCDVQTSKDDVTAGRVLVNGSAIAVRSIYAINEGAIDDANNLPSNAVSFVYGDAKNSPNGNSGTILDVSGLGGDYNLQLFVNYQTGNILAFRSFNGDNQTWNKWNFIYHTGNKPTSTDVGALPITGGNLQGQLSFSLSQPRNSANHLIYNGDDKGILACGFGYYQDRFDIHFYDENGDWASNPVSISRNGNCNFINVFDNGQRVYSPNNPQPIDLSGYATQNWVLQNFVQSIDLTAPAEVGFWDGRGYPRATDGAAMYNFNMVGGSSNVGNFIIRYTRRLVNNVWYVLN
ncbi:phage tail protein [Citrobacter freundii]